MVPLDVLNSLLQFRLLRTYAALMTLEWATENTFVACHEQAKKLLPQVGKLYCASNGARRGT